MVRDLSALAVARRLREARARLFQSAADAARALDMKPVTVRAHESGQNRVSSFDLERYARRYGVDVAWLLTGDGPIEAQRSSPLDWGATVQVIGLLRDGVWIPDHEMLWYPKWGQTKHISQDEWELCSDPRFPHEVISAYKVNSGRTHGEYPDGTIVFGVPNYLVGYRNGDHVIAVHTRGEFTEWTVRRVKVSQRGAVLLEALISDDAGLALEESEKEKVEVAHVVIGSVTRRPVNTLTIDARVRLERELKGQRVDEELFGSLAEAAGGLASERSALGVEILKKYAEIPDYDHNKDSDFMARYRAHLQATRKAELRTEKSATS